MSRIAFTDIGRGVLAHQGGWDEIALVGGPILVIVVLLAVAKRRVDAITRDDPDAEPDDDPAPGR